jgi:LmbE family N-acetylglucosaminyl deacetylase
MLSLNIPASKKAFTVLCLGAHSDDIEIGCGATILYLQRILPNVYFHWVVLSAAGTREQEARRAVELFTPNSQKQVFLKDYRDGFLPYAAAEIKDFFEDMKERVNPDLIFTHREGDAHQDHRLVSELTWNTFRNHMILEYEIPKYDGDMGRPNVFVWLEPNLYEQKLAHLSNTFESQQSKPWFASETFLGLMRLRGMECNSPSGYAEAFHARKIVIGPVA